MSENTKILFELFLPGSFYEEDDLEEFFFESLARCKPVEMNANNLGLENNFNTNDVVSNINSKIEDICSNDKEFTEFNVLSEISDCFRRVQNYLTEDDQLPENVLLSILQFRITITKDDKLLQKTEYYIDDDLDTIDKYDIYSS
tara:strand:- start:70 stop:501 length:432 start_codon:yes stop_codon:yes gene_type:complete